MYKANLGCSSRDMDITGKVLAILGTILGASQLTVVCISALHYSESLANIQKEIRTLNSVLTMLNDHHHHGPIQICTAPPIARDVLATGRTAHAHSCDLLEAFLSRGRLVRSLQWPFFAGKIRLQLKIARRCIALYIGLHSTKVRYDHDSHLRIVTGHLDSLQIQQLDGFAAQDRHAIYLTALLHASLRTESGSGTDLEGTTLVGDNGSVSSVGDSIEVGALIDQHDREHHHCTHEIPAGGAESGSDMAAEAWAAQALQPGM